VLRAQRRVIDVATGHTGPPLVQAAVDHQHFFGREFGERAGFVEQVLVRYDLAAAHAGFAGDDQFGLASSMRVAREPDAKPPNTTEWMAPMRAQARMAKAASAIIGM
jgi:hypothetical protein